MLRAEPHLDQNHSKTEDCMNASPPQGIATT